MSTTIVTRSSGPPGNQRSKSNRSTTTVKTVKSSNSNNNNNSKRQKARSTLLSRINPLGKSDLVSQYASTLLDPFDYPPVRLGWGCLVNSQLGSASARGFLTPNATDGSAIASLVITGANLFSASSSPFNQSTVLFGGTPVYSFGAAANNGANLLTETDQFRVVSAGIRLYPIVSADDLSPVAYYGNISGVRTIPLYQAVTASALANTPNMEVTTLPQGSGVFVAWRPQDPKDYDFKVVTDTTPLGSIPSVVIYGALSAAGGTARAFAYEWIVNFEYLTGIERSTGTMGNSAEMPTVGDVADKDSIIREILRSDGQHGHGTIFSVFRDFGSHLAQPATSFMTGTLAGLGAGTLSLLARNRRRLR